MFDVDPTTLGFEFGASAILGGILGFATKQVAKLLALVIGAQLMAFRYLESQEIIIVDWNRLSAGLLDTQERAAEGVHWLESALSVATVGAGFTSGFLIGYHRG
ncbi:FUN14 domain-containing protein [Natronolimnohabitans innermongolicus]|uniref:FUN14 family protein n=1 Tax=Natronolimnohabitans innermongolicus JCM 12255 TaxID=1227499 RepID=L9XK60_9EURY|nr:FUN14 domain-containing protein [Natronolimnohabitans innermongolicus]ELY62115.1 FUN14 family protein [Natronolimnohabitans innermongolicus JCM 12255]